MIFFFPIEITGATGDSQVQWKKESKKKHKNTEKMQTAFKKQNYFALKGGQGWGETAGFQNLPEFSLALNK